MSKITFTNNICSKCGNDLTKAVNLFGSEIKAFHVNVHLREDFENLLKRWENKLKEMLDKDDQWGAMILNTCLKELKEIIG